MFLSFKLTCANYVQSWKRLVLCKKCVSEVINICVGVTLCFSLEIKRHNIMSVSLISYGLQMRVNMFKSPGIHKQTNSVMILEESQQAKANQIHTERSFRGLRKTKCMQIPLFSRALQTYNHHGLIFIVFFFRCKKRIISARRSCVSLFFEINQIEFDDVQLCICIVLSTVMTTICNDIKAFNLSFFCSLSLLHTFLWILLSQFCHWVHVSRQYFTDPSPQEEKRGEFITLPLLFSFTQFKHQ